MSSFVNKLRNFISPTNPIRLIYHKVVAVLAAVRYFFPANKLKVIAVTGTKGKTSTIALINDILREAGKRVGVASTIRFQVGNRSWDNITKQTTVGRFTLQKLLREMVDEGCEYAILEATSHAMSQSRLWGVNVDTAVLTNIENDHLEYHGGMEGYIEAKSKIFRNINRSPRKPGVQKVIVLNRDDKQYEHFSQFVADRVFTYGQKQATVYATNVEESKEGVSFTLNIPNEKVEVQLKMQGMFNVYNALAAASVAVAHHVSLHTIKAALEKAKGVPGRLEKVEAGQEYTVVVDYAHTEESLEKLCALYKKLAEGKVILVFGATGGGRDRAKRPKMGQVADAYADLIVVTNDDPYTEDEMQIIEDISKGINRKEGEGLWKIPDRADAIRLALTNAKKEDIVLIAGKGCEKVQVIGEEHLLWDDREIVKEFLGREVVVEIKGKEKTGVNKCLES